jgi:hypothetical protein
VEIAAGSGGEVRVVGRPLHLRAEPSTFGSRAGSRQVGSRDTRWQTRPRRGHLDTARFAPRWPASQHNAWKPWRQLTASARLAGHRAASPSTVRSTRVPRGRI